jgi:hypothetical protein
MIDITLNPANTALIIRPGAIATQTYLITNNSTGSQEITTLVNAWLPNGDNGDLRFDPLTNQNIKFSIDNDNLSLGTPITLAPAETKKITLVIHPLDTTPIADYYFSFFVQKNETNLQAKIGGNLLLTVSNEFDTPAKTEITQFKINHNFVDSFFTPISISTKIKNNTLHLTDLQGKIDITRNNQKYKTIKLENKVALAYSSRQLDTITLSPPLFPGLYRATITMDAKLNTPNKTITFFVAPYSFIAIITLAIILYFVFRKKSN